ncbi:MAG: hypothetical protein IKR13_06315 [Victivallales bacterium]|nr:hypothetical protein [Victivallales bacterium]
MNQPHASNPKVDTAMSYLALVYLAALFLAIPLRGQLLAADLIAPLMLWQLWRKHEELLEVIFAETKWLVFAFAWMCLALATQFARGTGTLYDFAVFGYMAVIYFFYRVTPLPPRKVCTWTGMALLGLCFLGWLAIKLAPDVPFFARMLYTDEHFLQLSYNKLVIRYQFLFDNPNLLGSAYILPVILLLPMLETRLSKLTRWWQAGVLVLVCLLACLPLFASASKHLVMTFGLLAGTWTLLPLVPQRIMRTLATIAVASFGLLCLITVIFQTYPALQRAPWVDFSKRGNYSVHQEIYAKILLHEGIGGMLFGHSPLELQALYPKYADAEKIRNILEPYGFGGETEQFATFMDPHQEYLNFASFFGVPALLALLVFLFAIARKGVHTHRWDVVLFVLGVLLSFCWDDLGSKRWLWAALALVQTSLPTRTQQNANK